MQWKEQKKRASIDSKSSSTNSRSIQLQSNV